jgi:T-complex protein 1 subunit alpha
MMFIDRSSTTATTTTRHLLCDRDHPPLLPPSTAPISMQTSQHNTLSLDGLRTTGPDVRMQNVMAALAVANVVKSSLGPVGLDKMLVDQVGECIITNDGATILKKLDVEHPAGKVLVDLAELQDREVGDGTTTVVILAAELLRRANELVKKGLHPTTVISGYKLALKEAVDYVKQNLTIPSQLVTDEHLLQAAMTSMSSKIIGPECVHYADIAVRAMKNVKTQKPDGSVSYPVAAVNIIKAHGKSSRESQLVDGYALATARAAQGMPSSVQDAKIALLDFNLNRHRLKLGIQVTIKDPAELEALQKREADITKERIQQILKSGANVVVTSKGIDDLCLKYFVEAHCIALRRVSNEDMRRLAKATGGTVVTTMADFEGGEGFDAAWLGRAQQVVEERVGDGEVVFVKGCAQTSAQTVVLRGANDNMLDEIERSLHDSLCVVKRVLESNKLVAGGGAVEVGLSVHLEDFAMQLGTREQLPVSEFAQALLVIPKTLAVNAAKDATELIAKLRAMHAKAGRGDAALRYSGLDLINGTVRDNFKAGVLEPALSKVKAMRFATEAAVTILRIDDLIQLNPSDKPAR